jgi:PIN domain nuclease of toxin-antitoxin system
LPASFDEGVDASGFERLPITFAHAARAGALPRHHRDPFDRMLIAQAQVEGLTLVTRDRSLTAYEVAILPA